MANVTMNVQPEITRGDDSARRPVGVRAFGPKSIVAYILLFGLTVYFLTPLYWLAISATKDNTDLFSSFGLWLAHFNLWQNLAETFTHDGGT